MLTGSDAWKRAFPGAVVGVLCLCNVANPASCAALDERKQQVESHLRNQLAGKTRANLLALPVFRAYEGYYGGFKKTYHVLLQIESVAWKGKSIPRVAALVEAMFVAELKNGLLTAGHDLDAVHLPLRLDVSRGDEQYVRINGQEQVLKAGDMWIGDAQGVISSVLYGPDQRTSITVETRRALFTTYAPSGIGEAAVRDHLADIRDNVLLVAPQAETECLEIHCGCVGGPA